jgi:ankyrin repeat protein
MGENKPCTCCGKMTTDTDYLSASVKTGSYSYSSGSTTTTTTYYNNYSSSVPLCSECQQHQKESSGLASLFSLLGGISILMIIASFFTKVPVLKIAADLVTAWTLILFDLPSLGEYPFFLRLASVVWVPVILYITSSFIKARYEVKWIHKHPGHESLHGGVFIANTGKFEEWKPFLFKKKKNWTAGFIAACIIIAAGLAVPFANRAMALYTKDTASLSTMLSNAASRSDTLSAKLFLKRGADPNPALYSAVENQNIELLTLLFASGADPNYRLTGAYPADAKLETLPTVFSSNILLMTPEMVRLFLEAGADPNAPAWEPKAMPEYQLYPLCQVIDSEYDNIISYFREERFEIASMLIEAGADPGKKDSPWQAKRSLGTAMKKNWPEMIELLIKAGAEMTRADAIAMLNDCIKKDRPGALEALLKAGAPANVRNEEGYTLIETAMKGNKKEMGRMLLEYGANPRMKNEYGLDAYDQVRNDPELKALLDEYKK